MSKSLSSGRPVRVAVAGLGFMGLTHLRIYQQIAHARVVAVCDSTRLPVNGRLGGMKGNIQKAGDIQLDPAVHVYSDFAALLADTEVDVVDICTPTPLHADQAVAALQARKHVLCEKPLMHELAQARRVLAAADAAPNFLMPAMCMRFWPGWSWLKAAVTERRYGRVLAAAFRRVSPKPDWNKHGSKSSGALIDLHIHDIDFCNFLFGCPQAIYAGGVKNEAGAVEHLTAQYIYTDGPAVAVESSRLTRHQFNMGFEVYCEGATLSYDFARGAMPLQIVEKGKKPRLVQPQGTDGYGGEIRYFVDCVARNRRPDVVTAQDAVTALEIYRAEEKSIRTGKIVKL